MKLIKGEKNGFIKDGYGERQVVIVDFIPDFHNNGYNDWAPTVPCRLVVSGLDVNHSSFDGNDYSKERGRFVGWIYLAKGEKKTPVFVNPDYDNADFELYRING